MIENKPTQENDFNSSVELTEEKSNPSSDETNELEYLSDKDLLDQSLTLFKTQLPQNSHKTLLKIKEIIKNRQLEELNQKKQEFVASGGNPIDFEYKNEKFDSFFSHYFEHKKKLNAYLDSIKKTEQENYAKKLVLIDLLKKLYLTDSVNPSLYKIYKEIRVEWENTGNVPAEHYKILNNNYYHHLRNFFSFLDINKELQNRLFQENLTERLAIIAHTKELINEPNIPKALNEIHLLHKRWKNTDPVSEKDKHTTWEEFQQLSKQVLDRKKELIATQEKEQQENLEQKNLVLSKIELLIEKQATTQKQWKEKIDLYEKLKNDFVTIKHIPKETINASWEKFRELSKQFYHQKNEYFKEQKEISKESILKKHELIAIAKENLTNPSTKEAIEIFKKIQNEWKNIKSVNNSQSNKLWFEFKETCDSFFTQLKNEQNQAILATQSLSNDKKNLLASFKSLHLNLPKEEAINELNTWIKKWFEKNITENTIKLDLEFEKYVFKKANELEIEEKTINELLIEQKIKCIETAKNDFIEQYFLNETRNQLNKLSMEINQLENNLGFFNHSKPNAITDSISKEINEKNELESQLTHFSKRIKKIIREKLLEENKEAELKPIE